MDQVGDGLAAVAEVQQEQRRSRKRRGRRSILAATGCQQAGCANNAAGLEEAAAVELIADSKLLFIVLSSLYFLRCVMAYEAHKSPRSPLFRQRDGADIPTREYKNREPKQTPLSVFTPPCRTMNTLHILPSP